MKVSKNYTIVIDQEEAALLVDLFNSRFKYMQELRIGEESDRSRFAIKLMNSLGYKVRALDENGEELPMDSDGRVYQKCGSDPKTAREKGDCENCDCETSEDCPKQPGEPASEELTPSQQFYKDNGIT